MALGGDAGRNHRGHQIGLFDTGWHPEADDDPLFGAVTSARRGVHWNLDVVTALPDGAQALASTPAGELQAARFSDTVWGVQWHPEIDDRIFGAWAEDDREETERLGVDTDRLLAEVAAARTESSGVEATRHQLREPRGRTAMTRPNRKTVRSELIKLGFEDTDAALAGLARLGHAAAPIEAILGRTADPDAALDGLLTLADAAPDREDLLAALSDDEGTAMRLLSVLERVRRWRVTSTGTPSTGAS